MGAIQFIENLDRTTLTISDPEFENNVEMAVSAIAERHGEDVPFSECPSGSKMLSSSDAEMVARTLANSDKPVEKGLDSGIAMTGLLRTMQKPLTSMGRIFSDEKSTSLHSTKANWLGEPPHLGSPSSTGLSPVVFQPPGTSYDGRRTPEGMRDTQESVHRQVAMSGENNTQVGQATSGMAQVQRIQRDEHNDVVESVSPDIFLGCAHKFCSSTLASMFPDLDKELIYDVVRIKQGR